MTAARHAEMYIDGACSGNPGPAGIGVVVFVDGSGSPTRQLSRYVGEATNNVAEYLALVYALQEALQLGCQSVLVRTDSELLVRQLQGRYKIRNGQLKIFHDLIEHLSGGFRTVQIEHIPRTQNLLADRLAVHAVKTRAPAHQSPDH